MTILPNGVNWLYTEAERRDAILSDTRGVISLDTSSVLPGDRWNPHPWSANTSYGASIVTAYHHEIQAAALANGVDPSLLAAVIYYENAHGIWKDFFLAPLPINSSILPGNVEIGIQGSTNWAQLIGKSTAEVLHNPALTIDIAAVLLSRIAERLPNPTPSAIATLYNALSADEVRSYGLTVELYMKYQPWLLENPRDETFQSLPFGVGDSILLDNNNWRLGKDHWLADSTLGIDELLPRLTSIVGAGRPVAGHSSLSKVTGIAGPGQYDGDGPEAGISNPGGDHTSVGSKSASTGYSNSYAAEKATYSHSSSSSNGYSEKGYTTGNFAPSRGEWAGGSGNQKNGTPDPGLPANPDYTSPQPIVLDLDGNGLSITELSHSTQFVDGGDGLQHRTAWAGIGDGVLFFDVSGDGQIKERREYVFTEWDPTATSDLDALRSVFDTNGDGKLTSADAGWGNFKVLVTKADDTTEAKTLAQLGIELPKYQRRHPFPSHFQPNTIRAIGAPS